MVAQTAWWSRRRGGADGVVAQTAWWRDLMAAVGYFDAYHGTVCGGVFVGVHGCVCGGVGVHGGGARWVRVCV